MVGKIPEMDLARYAVADLAGQLHCSERHFSRLFREEFGVPFRNHQIELKLQHARQLLLESNIKIASIAGTSGYRHLGLFNNAFKKRFGVTPSEWRRQNLNSDTANQLRHSLPQLRQMPTPSIPVNQGC
jgi:AraC-like DNA-binding protein